MNLIYGNCYEEIKNIPDKSVDLVYIDIPYLIESGDGGNSSLAKRILKINKQDLANINDGIDYTILDELCRVMKKIYIYIWCSRLQILDLMKYFIEQKNCKFNVLVWCKTNPTPAINNTLLPDLEYCLLFREDGTKLYGSYETKSKWYMSSINKSDKDLYDHPTIKPLDLVKRHIFNSTKEGDVVLDCFMGSGTTGVACKQLGREFIGIEIDKTYYDIAVDRINGISQKEKEIRETQLSLFDM